MVFSKQELSRLKKIPCVWGEFDVAPQPFTQISPEFVGKIDTELKSLGFVRKSDYRNGLFDVQAHEYSVEEHQDDNGWTAIIPFHIILKSSSKSKRYARSPTFEYHHGRTKIKTHLECFDDQTNIIVFNSVLKHRLDYYGYGCKLIVFDVDKIK